MSSKSKAKAGGARAQIVEYLDEIAMEQAYVDKFNGKFSLLGAVTAWESVHEYLEGAQSRGKAIHACLQFFIHPKNFMADGALADGKGKADGGVSDDILALLPQLETVAELASVDKGKTTRHARLHKINFTIVSRIALMALHFYGKTSSTTMGWCIKYGGSPCDVTYATIALALGEKQGKPRDKALYPNDKYGGTVMILGETCERFKNEKPYWSVLDWASIMPKVKKPS